jgi:DeoR/GlpR family transcriptional regulator of sugar metabolism
MKNKKRQAKIIATLRKEERATVGELAALFTVSRETIRRDLTELAHSGKIQKIHGGAILPRVFGEGSFGQRMSENAEAKARIAARAVELFCAGETLFIDTGSTTLYFAEKLADVSGLTIVTNSTEIARTVSSSNMDNRTFLLGGEYSNDNRQTVGTMVASQIRSFRVHHTVLTVAALDVRTGVMDFNIEEAQVAHAMIEQSETLTVLVDGSKFNKLASFEVCPLSRIDQLVCDITPPDPLAEALEVAGVKTVIAT